MSSLFALGALNIACGSPDPYNINSGIIINPEFVYPFYFINIHSVDSEPLIIDNNSYFNYNDFVNLGTAPLQEEDINVSDATASVQVIKTKTDLFFKIAVENRPLPTTNDPDFIQGHVEVWAKFLNVDSKIPASRLITKANFDGTTSISHGFTFVGGNPADRSYTGILEANGFYKSQFQINLPFVQSSTLGSNFGSFYYEGRVNHYSVPSAPTFVS